MPEPIHFWSKEVYKERHKLKPRVLSQCYLYSRLKDAQVYVKKKKEERKKNVVNLGSFVMYTVSSHFCWRVGFGVFVFGAFVWGGVLGCLFVCLCLFILLLFVFL